MFDAATSRISPPLAKVRAALVDGLACFQLLNGPHDQASSPFSNRASPFGAKGAGTWDVGCGNWPLSIPIGPFLSCRWSLLTRLAEQSVSGFPYWRIPMMNSWRPPRMISTVPCQTIATSCMTALSRPKRSGTSNSAMMPRPSPSVSG
jgi:hypothetical protein